MLRADGEAGITPPSQGGDRKNATVSPEFKSRSVHNIHSNRKPCMEYICQLKKIPIEMSY